jgi:uncharacterized membrane protein YedE/YeeE
MSLFIGGLAFEDPTLADGVKVGVLGGSVLSAGVGYVVFLVAARRQTRLNGASPRFGFPTYHSETPFVASADISR